MQLYSWEKRDYGVPSDLCSAGFPCADIYTPVLLAVLLSCIALGHILTYAVCRLVLWPLLSRGWKVHWRRVIIVGAVLGQVLQTGFDMSRVIKIYALHFGNRDYWLDPRWEDAAAFAVGVLLQCQTQLCFTERAFVYSAMLRVSRRMKWLATVIVTLAILLSTAMGITVAVQIKTLDSLKRLSPGDPTAHLYGVALVVWALSSAVADVFLCAVMTTELIMGRRRIGDSIKGHRLLVVLRQMALVMVEAGIVLALVQAISAIAWIIEASQKERQAASTWIYLPLLCLSRVYTITFLRFSATSLRPTVAQDERNSIGSNQVETVEYDWGKPRSDASLRGEGVRTVTGLPLEALGESALPSSLNEEERLGFEGYRSLSHRTSTGSKMSLSRKPSLSTVEERTMRPVASTSHGVSSGSTLLEGNSDVFHSPSRAYTSPHHTPRILDSSPSAFPFPFGSHGDGDRGSPGSRGRRLGRRSQESIGLRYEEGDSDERFGEVRGGSLDISPPRPSEHTLLASTRFSPPVSPTSSSHSRGRMESLESRWAEDGVSLESRRRSRVRRSGDDYEGVGTSSL